MRGNDWAQTNEDKYKTKQTRDTALPRIRLGKISETMIQLSGARLRVNDPAAINMAARFKKEEPSRKKTLAMIKWPIAMPLTPNMRMGRRPYLFTRAKAIMVEIRMIKFRKMVKKIASEELPILASIKILGP